MTAITTELGRNSASIQYGPSATGADLFTTLQSVDAWLRNDTWAGYATASGTAVTGFGTVWNTVAKAGDYIMIAGQQRVVLSVVSDNSITVTQAFSPAITIASAVRVINNVQPTAGTLTGVGAAGTNARGATTGTVYVTNGSTIVNGVGTFFLSECTSSVVPVAVNGTVAVDTAGNITGSGTTFITGADGTPQRLQPGDCVAVLSAGQTYYMVIASVTSDTAATTTAASAPTTAIPAGATISKATNGIIGRAININGRVRTITGISGNTQLQVNAAMDFTDSNIKLKVYPRGLVSNGSTTQSYGTAASAGTGTTLSIGPALTAGTFLQAGMVIAANGGSCPAGTTIVNQQYSTGTSVVSTTVTGQSGGNQLVATSTASIAVGLLVQGNAAALAGVPAGTVVTAINGNTLSLSNNLTSLVSAATAFFYPPGGVGVYTVSGAINFTNVVLNVGQITGVGTNFFWDLGVSNANFSGVTTATTRQVSVGDQIIFGDEIRTFRFDSVYNATTSSSIGYITDYTNYTSATPVGLIRQPVVTAPFKRDCSFIFANTATFTTDIRTGDDLIIDGTEVTVSQVVSDTQLKLTNDFPSNPTGNSVIYKKLKIHGYTLEGTREGGPLGGPTKWSNSGTITATTGTVFPVGTSTITVAAAPLLPTTFNFIKLSSAGGPPKPITGQATYTGNTVTGVGTAFTSELYIGAEIMLAGQYLTVAVITSDTVLSVLQVATPVVSLVTPVYRTIPLYTYISNISGTTITLGAPIENNLVSAGANPPQVYFPSTNGDFVEYVYSAPNYYAEINTAGTTATNVVQNGSYDRKYVGFRYWPLFQGTIAAPVITTALATANSAYAMPVYERWAGSYGGFGGAGINQADLSGGLMSSGTQATTVYTLQYPIAGSVTTATSLTTLTGTGFPTSTLALAGGTAGLAGSTYTINASQSQPASGNGTIVHSLNGVYDVTGMTQVSGGFLYLFATKRYVILQGKSNANVQTQWVGCIEFERAQPEDISGTSGLGTTQGVSFTAYGGTQLAQGAVPPNQSTAGYSQAIQFTPGVAPWPTFAYVNGNRFPTGSMQTPTLPVIQTYPIHGGLFSVPRVRNSSGDLVGINAHVYSAATITTGRWGHQVELGSYGSYAPANQNVSPTVTASTLVLGANAVPQVHLGQILPVYTNVYNSKRFMFSPVVVLGPAYDPDIRGRFFGMKVIPSGLGTLLDTVSITSNASTFFYDSTQTAVDHWVIGTPPQGVSYTAALPGQTSVLTTRYTTAQNTAQVQQSWRSLEDTNQQITGAAAVFYNNFRMAVPA